MKITDKNGVVYQLVPVKSTKEMHDKALSDDLWYEINPPPHIAYELMLSAAPEPELPEGLGVVAFMDHSGDSWSAPCVFALQLRFKPLILQSAALAALAEKEAELERKQGQLQQFHELLSEKNTRIAELAEENSDLWRRVDELSKKRGA